MSNFRKQFNKGVLELGILRLLSEQDHYGYSLIQELNERSAGVIEIKDGTLYPILYRLEDQKWIESYWETLEGRGKPRKYYQMTDSGRKRFEMMLEDYNAVNAGIQRVMQKIRRTK